jgi:GNAT superfamily N-acetyltransferase
MGSLKLVWVETGGTAFELRAFVDEQMVGLASGRRYGEAAYELQRVDVIEAWRRRGIGQSLVRAVQARACHVTACSVSEAGVRLLKRCGFEASVEPGAAWFWLAEPPLVGDRDF